MREKKDLRIKHYGVNEKGMILFFQGRMKYHRYYRSILTKLSESGYLVLGIPYGLKKLPQKLKETFLKLDVDTNRAILMSHASGDETIYRYARTTDFIIEKIIISSPTRNVIHYRDIPTLVLWSNKYRPNIALDIFTFANKRSNYHFIGYPNCSRYLFAGVGYSQYHDKYNRKPKKTFFNVDDFSHVDQEILDDINLFLSEEKVREKIAIFSENYLPFNSGVNILTKVLKTELEKEGKKVYPVTLRIKGVNYETYSQEKNVVVLPSVCLPGKKAKKEALLLSLRFVHMMKNIRAYQFDYIQLQTEFTIGTAGLLLRKMDNVPMVYTAHTMWNDMINKRYPKLLAKIINGVLNRFLVPPLKYADLMTVPTEKVKQYYMETWKKEEPIVVIPGCVDGDLFSMNKEDQEKLEKLKDNYQLRDKIVLGFVGRVSKEKNIDEVVDYFEKAANDISNLVLMIVGDGPYSDHFFERAKNSKFNDRIIMVGAVSNTQIKYYYHLLDIFCTSSTFETQGLTYVESMWCKTPVLAREDHCLDHFLNSGVNGLTFTDYETWLEGLHKIIDDEKFRNKMIKVAYETALTYEKHVWARRMYYLYTQAKLFNEKKITTFDQEAFKKIK